MKKFDMAKHIGNIDENYIADALTYKPVSRAKIRFIALAACIAIIVTSVPSAFILNKESVDTISRPQTTTTSTKQPTDPEKGLPDGFYYKDMETIELSSNNKLIFNTQFLTDGKNIYANLDEDTRPYIFEYTPLSDQQKQTILKNTLESAQKYHDNKEANTDIENFAGTFDWVKYSITTKEHQLQTKVKYVVNENITDVKTMALDIGGLHETYFERDPDDHSYSIYNDDCLYECIEPLKQYIRDVLGINELPQNVEIKSRGLTVELDPNWKEFGIDYDYWMEMEKIPHDLGANRILYATFDIDPKNNDGITTLEFVFYSAEKTGFTKGCYYLSEITVLQNIAGENYVKLIDEETALEWLLHGKCIGNIGQFDEGCDSCSAKGGLKDEDRIPDGLECSLVYIPEVIFVSDDQNITYDMPFYVFSVPSEHEDTYRVAYVPATEIEELNKILYEQTQEECAFYDHANGKRRENYTGSLFPKWKK